MNDKDIKKRNVLTSEEDSYYLDEEELQCLTQKKFMKEL